MNFIRNLLALVGVAAIVAAAAAYTQVQEFTERLDPDALRVYKKVGGEFMETLDPADALVRVVKVEDGMSPEDVVESLKSIAVELGLLFVGESPFYKQVQAVTGEPYRYVSFFSFCDATVGAMMADYNNRYTAFMPCRIALVADPDGTLWLQMMDLELLVYGGKPLPPDLKEAALKVRNSLITLMDRAAKGDF